MKKKNNTKKKEFSKLLLIQESILIWIVTIVLLILAFVCIKQEYFGELPWIAAMVGFPWSAYGVSQMYYYKKSMAENTKDGIKYESVIKELDNAHENYNKIIKEVANNIVIEGDNSGEDSMNSSDDINTDYGI